MKIRYIFAGIIIILNLFTILRGEYLNLLSLLLLGFVLYLINKVERTYQQDGSLTQNEKIQVILSEIFMPVIAGAFYYYCWKNKFPTRAGQANKYSWIIVGIMVLVIIVIGVLNQILAK